MNKQIQSIRDLYNREEVQKTYIEAVDKVGLWQSEKLMFSKYISKNDKILDLGCGAGRTTINLFKNGYRNIIGLDISDKFIEFAKSYCSKNNINISFVNGDATNLSFSDSIFDAVIFSYNGLMCIPGKKNRNSVLKEVYRVLKPNGIFIFTAHNRDDSGKYQYLWDEEKKKWENGTQDKNLEVFGDRITINQNSGEEVFVHFSSVEEMKKFIHQENFEIIEYIKREDICDENEAVKEFSGSTWFWVVKRNNLKK